MKNTIHVFEIYSLQELLVQNGKYMFWLGELLPNPVVYSVYYLKIA